MGYYTTFTLHCHPYGCEKVPDDASEIGDKDLYARNCGMSYHTYPVKWYSWEIDMRKYSEKHPDLVFCLEGEGEDGECWDAYFNNGKMQFCHAIISFEEFCPEKLK